MTRESQAIAAMVDGMPPKARRHLLRLVRSHIDVFLSYGVGVRPEDDAPENVIQFRPRQRRPASK